MAGKDLRVFDWTAAQSRDVRDKGEIILALKGAQDPSKRVEVRVTAKQKKLLALHRMTTGEGASAFFRRMIDQELEDLYGITE